MGLLADAVTNNVAWCALVSGGGGAADGIWVADAARPPLFPDAVTLAPGVPAASVAARLGDRPTCSVKDSFADVDLLPYGFRVLFDARWIAVDPVAAATDWSVVDDGAGLASWCDMAGIPGLPGAVLRDPSVRVLAHGTSGVVLNRSDTAVGLTNVFGTSVWDDVGALVAHHFPGYPAVGYEHGPDLDAALAAGFTDLGPLRVWLRDDGP